MIFERFEGGKQCRKVGTRKRRWWGRSSRWKRGAKPRMWREVGVSKHTLYSWKAKYGGMDVSEAQEAKQLRDENAPLKKLVADLSLDKDAL